MHPLTDNELREDLLPLINSVQPPLNIHRTLANHPDLLRAFWPLRQQIVKNNSLPARQHELLILRIAHRTQAEYEWRHHVNRGRQAGLTDDEIERVRQSDGVWQPADRLILTCADELLDHHQLSDETAAAMTATFGNDGTLDAIFTSGIYLAIAATLKTFAVPFEEA